jgi:phospholipid-binding lipoprotein MlaA
MKRKISLLLASLILSSSTLSSCALGPPPRPESIDAEIYDPIKDVNRGIFTFNDTLDRNILEPVASGYDSITPDFVQGAVRNFFETLDYPKILVSNLVQLKFGQAAESSGRFLINATLGAAGLIDVASDLGLPSHREDFGIALAYHDVPPGPYIMLPFLGPSNARDAVGRIVDGFLNPLNFIFYSDIDTDVLVPVTLSLQALSILQTRSDLLEVIGDARRDSVDFYLATQAAYYQVRSGLLYDGAPSESASDTAEDEEFGTLK